jgi:DNA repair protein RadA/Sms
MVDTVLSFEGDPSSPYRLVRAVKNRFGAANELGAFEMTETGLLSVDNPSALFLSDGRTDSKGSCVCVLQEGPRAMLIEIQALMDDCQASNPKRLAVGVDTNRVSMLLAVLHRHAAIPVAQYDAFVNAVGGIRATEPAADLAISLSIVSSLRDEALPADICCFGEIGLTGEVRPVQLSENRIREAAKLGFKKIMIPFRNLPNKPIKGIEIAGVRDISEAFAQIAAWA